MMFDRTAFDAFHRLRVSNPTTLFDTQFQYDLHPLLWETVTSGDASVFHNSNASCIRLVVEALR